MNERFWELVEQADEEGGDDPDIRDEVFARLIIAKCVEIANDYSDSGIIPTKINKYFGVE